MFNQIKKASPLPLLHSAEGEGTLHIKGQADVAVDFRFEQHQDGTLLLFCPVPSKLVSDSWNSAHWGDDSSKHEFVGLTSDNWHLKMSGLVFNRRGIDGHIGYFEFLGLEATLTPLDHSRQPRNGHAHLVRVPLTNCSFSPEFNGMHTFANGAQSTGQQVALRLDKQELTLCYRNISPGTRELLKERRIAGVMSEAVLPVTSWPIQSELEEVLDVLCLLLTFARSTRINWLGYDVCDADGEVLSTHCFGVTTSGYVSDLGRVAGLPILKIPSLPLFLEVAYASYQEFWDKWSLRAAIDTWLKIITGDHFMEQGGLLMSGCMEMLRASYLRHSGRATILEPEVFNAASNEIHAEVQALLNAKFPVDESWSNRKRESHENKIRQMSDHARGFNYPTFRQSLQGMVKQLKMGKIILDTNPSKAKNRAVLLPNHFLCTTPEMVSESIQTFVRIRDYLTHQGLFFEHGATDDGSPSGSWEGCWERYTFMQRFTASFLCSALGWPQLLPTPPKLVTQDGEEERDTAPS